MCPNASTTRKRARPIRGCCVRMVVVTEGADAASGPSLRTNAMSASSWPTMTETMTDTTSVHCSLLSSLVVSATHLHRMCQLMHKWGRSFCNMKVLLADEFDKNSERSRRGSEAICLNALEHFFNSRSRDDGTSDDLWKLLDWDCLKKGN